MKKLKKNIFLYTIILGFNITYSQVDENITKQDYYVYVSNLCGRIIQSFGSSKNQTVVKISATGDRKYLVTYMDNFTQKMTVGPFDCNPYDIVSFEKFKVEELERRKRREKQRLEDIEYERKKEEERKRKIREEKIKKEKERIISERRKVLKGRFGEYFFFKGNSPRGFFKDNFHVYFRVFDEFIKNDKIIENKIEDIGQLTLRDLRLKNQPPLFKIKVGVKNFFDDSKIKYFINDEEVNFDLGLKNGRWNNMNYKPVKHLKNDFFKSDDYLFRNKVIFNEFKFPFPLYPFEDFKDFNGLMFNFDYLKFLYENRYKTKSRIGNLINFLILKEIVNQKMFIGPNYQDKYANRKLRPKNLIIDVYERGKKIIVNFKLDGGKETYFEINTKKWWIDKNGYRYLNPTDVFKIEREKYQYFKLMNSN